MKKFNTYYFSVLYVLIITIFLFSNLSAIENKKFLSLKNKKVNLRQGPSFKYPIKLIYIKKNLPVVVIDKFENWRKIIDFKNNSGWIHISQLTKKKTAINIKKNSILYKKSTIYSKPIAKIEIGKLLFIDKCKIRWCKISSKKFQGWVYKNSLWGNVK